MANEAIALGDSLALVPCYFRVTSAPRALVSIHPRQREGLRVLEIYDK